MAITRLGQAIIDFCEYKGWSRYMFARHYNLDYMMIHRLTAGKGRRICKSSTLATFSRLFTLPVENYFEKSEGPDPTVWIRKEIK